AVGVVPGGGAVARRRARHPFDRGVLALVERGGAGDLHGRAPGAAGDNRRAGACGCAGLRGGRGGCSQQRRGCGGGRAAAAAGPAARRRLAGCRVGVDIGVPPKDREWALWSTSGRSGIARPVRLAVTGWGAPPGGRCGWPGWVAAWLGLVDEEGLLVAGAVGV